MQNRINEYLNVQGLALDKQSVQISVLTLQSVLQKQHQILPDNILRYPNQCADMADYDLSTIFSDVNAALNQLSALHVLLDSVSYHTKASWLGVYCAQGIMHEARLIKLAYRGWHGAAELPLTHEFAKQNNTSRVALTGWGTIIDDASGWHDVEQDGAQVASCICLPICTESEAVLGVIEAKSLQSAYFDAEKQAWLVALALTLPSIFTKLPLID